MSSESDQNKESPAKIVEELSRDKLCDICRKKKLKIKGSRSELINQLTVNTCKRKAQNEIEERTAKKRMVIASPDHEVEAINEEDYEPDFYYSYDDDNDSIIEEDINERPVEADVAGKFVFIKLSEIMKFKVDELKDELKKRGLLVSGKKAKLQNRLKEAMENKVKMVAPKTTDSAGKDFNRNAR